MKKLLSIILSIAMILSMQSVAFAEDTFVSSGVREVKGIIKVGVDANFMPFEYMEKDKLVGFDIELMNRIGGRIGYGIEFVNMSFDKIFPAVVNGEVDCAISAIAVTKERKEVVDFSEIYLDTYEQIDETSSQIVNYAIVFNGNSSEKEKLIEAAGHTPLIYTLVNTAIKELKKDGTIEKLLEKYNIPKANYAQGPGYPVDVSVDNLDSDSNAVVSGTPLPPSEWAAKEIDYAYAVGITDTNKDYHFRENITREEFCELIYNIVVLTSDEITAPITGSFTDTKNDKILMLNGMGIISGKSETEFAPKDYLTREEAATIIVRMVNKVAPMAATEMWFEYDDINEISEWASESIQTISNLGFMKGVDNNKFAPKDTYTTEQAIVTLARVFKGAEVAGAINNNSSIGIIGGTDGPTSIVVGDSVNNAEKYESFQMDISSNFVEIDDFYVDEAIKLTEESGELAADEDLISYYAPGDDVKNRVLSIGKMKYSQPAKVYYIATNKENIIDNIKAFSDEVLDVFDIEKLLKLNRVDFSVIGNMINASYGADSIAALAILTNSRGYIMPNNFTGDFALYLQYDGEYSALVSFSEFGDRVIKATMSFVNNGERDNIFRRIFEITQGLGDNSIDVAIVK